MSEFYEGGKPVLRSWSEEPAVITMHSLRTGVRLREPSLVAAGVREGPGWRMLEKCLAAGETAGAYQNVPGTAVFSPLRRGQVACYDGARFLFQVLLRQTGPMLPKPVVCVRMAERATQVEEIAMQDALMQAGARRVLLYQGSFSEALERAAERRELRHAVVISIEPQE